MRDLNWLECFLLFSTLHIHTADFGDPAWGKWERRHELCLSKSTAHLGWGTEAFGYHCPTNPLEKDDCYLFFSTAPVLNEIQSYLIGESETQRD